MQRRAKISDEKVVIVIEIIKSLGYRTIDSAREMTRKDYGSGLESGFV